MSQIINYAEFLMATTGKRCPVIPNRDLTSEELADYQERIEAFKTWYETTNESAPDWFTIWQDRAVAMIRKILPQAHLFPRNRRDYEDLKTEMWIEQGTGIGHQEPYNYQELVRDGIANQIKFMYDNEVYFENGYLNSSNTFVIGTWTHGGQPQVDIDRLFTRLCPMSYNNFETLGWTYGALDHPLDSNIFYRGEK